MWGAVSVPVTVNAAPTNPPFYGMQASSPSWDVPKEVGEAAAVEPRGYALVGAFPAHAAAASCLALHPCLPMVATGEPVGYLEACVPLIHVVQTDKLLADQLPGTATPPSYGSRFHVPMVARGVVAALQTS